MLDVYEMENKEHLVNYFIILLRLVCRARFRIIFLD